MNSAIMLQAKDVVNTHTVHFIEVFHLSYPFRCPSAALCNEFGVRTEVFQKATNDLDLVRVEGRRRSAASRTRTHTAHSKTHSHISRFLGRSNRVITNKTSGHSARDNLISEKNPHTDERNQSCIPKAKQNVEQRWL